MPFVPDQQQPAARPAQAPPLSAVPPPNAGPAAGRFVPDAATTDSGAPQEGALKTAGRFVANMGESGLQMATSVPAAVIGAAGYAGAAIGRAAGADVNPDQVQSDLANRFTYQPSVASATPGTDAAINGAVNRFVEPIAQGYGDATQSVRDQYGNFVGDAMQAAPGAFKAAGAIVPGAAGARAAVGAAARAPVTGAAPTMLEAARNVARPVTPQPVKPGMKLPPATTAEEVVARQAASSAQNMGAAAAAPNLTNVSPELKAAIVETARRNGGAINPEVLAHHVDADSLPVPVRLTEGQATGDVRLLSEEQNMRGRVPQFAERFAEQNRALGENLRSIRDTAGDRVFTASPVEHGDTLIGAYRAVDQGREAAINAAYNDLRTAAGGNIPIGARTLLNNSAQALHKQLIFDHAPKSVMNALEGFAAKPGSMTFENFEALRTNLATIQRTATDGLERRAAGIIRQQMEELPLVPGAQKLKPLADKARALYRERAQALEADPAYAAAIDESVPPDRFVQKFVTGGTRDNLARMRAAIGGDESAVQTMGVAALDYLRDQARLNAGYEGNFASSSYNKALQKLGPGVRSLLPANVVDQLEQLGRVATRTTQQPRGSFVNNSNTFTAAAAEGVKGAAEGAANVAAVGVPVGTWIRKGMEGAASRKAANRAMEPGAGLGRLDTTNPRTRQP